MHALEIVLVGPGHLNDYVVKHLARQYAFDRILLRRQGVVVAISQDELLAVVGRGGTQVRKRRDVVNDQLRFVGPDDRPIRIDEHDPFG
jgi:hypothetical protein